MLARTHLLYGEWLRRQRRPADARGQLRTACQMLEEIGMEAFAQRGRRELRAAGGTTGKRAVTTTVKLTAQEAQIARLAADGLSNPEIGTRLFLSPRTVQFHLRKVFIKLDITSRAQLSRALSGSLGTSPPRRGRADHPPPHQRLPRGRGRGLRVSGGCRRLVPRPFRKRS